MDFYAAKTSRSNYAYRVGEMSITLRTCISQKDHSVKHMEFSILHWMGDPINPNTTNRRRSQELYYIWAFPTLHPAGINMFV